MANRRRGRQQHGGGFKQSNAQGHHQGRTMDNQQREARTWPGKQNAGRSLFDRAGPKRRYSPHDQHPRLVEEHAQEFTFLPRGRKRARFESTSTQPTSPPPMSATSSRPDTPIPFATPSKRPCRFFAKGHCRAGDTCRFSHDPIDDTESSSPARKRPCRLDLGNLRKRLEPRPSTPSQHECSFWKRGIPHEENCPFAHHTVVNPVRWRRPSCIYCPFFAEHSSCPMGRECPLSHVPVHTPMTGVEETGPAVEVKREFASIGREQVMVFPEKSLEDVFAEIM